MPWYHYNCRQTYSRRRQLREQDNSSGNSHTADGFTFTESSCKSATSVFEQNAKKRSRGRPQGSLNVKGTNTRQTDRHHLQQQEPEKSVRDTFLQTRREKFFLKQTRVRVAVWVPLLQQIGKLNEELQMQICSKELRENGC